MSSPTRSTASVSTRIGCSMASTRRLARSQGERGASIPKARALAARSLAILGVLTACGRADTKTAQVAVPQDAAPEPSSTSASPVGALPAAGVVSWPQDARVSLDLRRVPLTTLLSMLSAQSGLRFRLATIPDVEVSVSLQNAPLQQAIRDLLALNGFDLKPGPDAFWLVPAQPAASSPDLFGPSQRPHSPAAPPQPAGTVVLGALNIGAKGAEAWRWWTSAQAPPRRWMVPGGSEQVAYDGEPTASGVPGLAPFGVRVRLQPAEPELSRWKSSVQKFLPSTPGVLPLPTAGNSGAPLALARWCVRWPVFLRTVPARCILVIESERPANFYINGARLLSAWSGRRTLDVSGALASGSNLLALEWTPLPPSTSTATDAPASAPSPPIVRYEWLVAQ